jgi:DNA-binding LacI/PurR family transcriptional regulator
MTRLRPVTLQTIADAVGVSRTTVSNAYNRPDQLAPALRDRILTTARTLGYPGPDPAARRLRSGGRDAVGILLGAAPESALADPSAVLVLRGIARSAAAAGAGLLLVSGDRVRDAVVQSLCIYAPEADDPRVAAARERRVPLVVVDGSRVPGHAYVGCDDRRGARMAAEHLRRLGQRRVAVVGADGERLAGYREAIEAAGIRDVSVVGFGDLTQAAATGLPTVRRPLLRMGEIAGQLLTAGRAAGDVILPVELIVA